MPSSEPPPAVRAGAPHHRKIAFALGAVTMALMLAGARYVLEALA